MVRHFAVTLFTILLAFHGTAFAQPTRYEVGRKYVAFEIAWDNQTDAAARKRSLPILKKTMAAFFGGTLDQVAKLFDEARHSLESENPVSEQVRWADSITLGIRPRLIDASLRQLKVKLERLYDPGVSVPAKAGARLRFVSLDGKLQSQPVTLDLLALPAEAELDVDPRIDGDCQVRLEVLVDDKVLATTECGVSRVANLNSRLDALRGTIKERFTPPTTTESHTLTAHFRVLDALTKSRVFETDYPASRMLTEAEEISRLPSGGAFFESRRAGQFWLTLATEKGPAAVRLFVPENLDENKPFPIVVAMHGAGGSENMFFDGYGHGELVRQAAKRGWLVVATRTEGFFNSVPVGAVIDELAKRYPIDSKRVFAVGHSMGAGQLMGLASATPDRWRGLACLGGGGGLRDAAKAKDVPFFVGVGSEDFALPGAKMLAESLKKAGSQSCKYVEYPNIEHIGIVQVALPDVFQWFDSLSK